MSAKERRRLLVFDRVREGQLSVGAAARRLEISYRQCRRSYKRYRAEGAKGLVHLSRGRPSNRAKPKELRCEVLRQYEEKYEGFGPTLAAEKLSGEGLVLDHETLSHAGAWFWPRTNGRRGADAESTAVGESAGRISGSWSSLTAAITDGLDPGMRVRA